MRSIIHPRPLAFFVCLIATLLLLSGSAGLVHADGNAAAQELKKLQGTWVVVEAERDGAPLDRIKGNKLVVKDNQFTVVTPSAELKGDLKLDPDKAPKAIDFYHQEGLLRDKKWEGIYKLDGDKLTLCYAEADSGKDRPDEFTAQEGSNRLLIVVERKKP
jgi:uncharacterized protein (TIGR03067 family)